MTTATMTRTQSSRPRSTFRHEPSVRPEDHAAGEVRAGDESGFRVRHAISDQLGPASNRLEVKTTAEAVIVSGRVASYYAKQLLTHAVQRAAGDRRVQNDAEVRSAA